MRIRLALLTALLPALVTAEPAAWRVAGSNGSEVVLLGSVHTLRESDYPLPPSIDALYESADRLVMEMDLDDLDPAAIQAALLRAAVLPADTRLADVVAPAVYREADSQASALGMDLALLDRFEPWLVAVSMLELGMSRMGYRADRGIEQYLLNRAAGDGLDVLGMESLATQVAVFDNLSMAQQEALLEQTLGEIESAETVMDEMIAAWRDGELETLADSLLADFDAFPDLYVSLVVERNTAWTSTIEAMLDDGLRYLIVVGGLHLVGDDSVIRMLGARGYTVERIVH